MLSYALAIAVAISSLILFSTAFFMSKIHRKDDFLWSAVGLFYALILWFDVRNITGTVLLGQAAATVLITSYCWQTIKLRRAIANPAQAAETNNFSVVRSLNGLFKRRKPKVESPDPPVVKAPNPRVTEQEIAIPQTPETVAPTDVIDKPVENKQVISDFQPTPEIKSTPEDAGQLEVAQAQPLPNKLPDTVAQSQPQPKPQVTPQVETLTVPLSQVDELVTEAAAAVNPNSQTTGNIEPENIDRISQPKVESAPEVITPEGKQSSFDSLEVVEVAEVLEAEVDDDSDRRESDRDNIIEVTTTEINVVTETTKIDRNQVDDSDPQA